MKKNWWRIREGASDFIAVVKGASIVMIIRILGAAITYASHVLIARWMGEFEFGIFAYAWVWVTVLGFLAPLGLSVAVVRFIPDYIAKNKWHRVHGLIQRSQMLVAGMSVGLASIAALLTYVFQGWISAYYITPLYLAFVSVIFFALTDLHEGLSRSFNWLKLAYTPSYVIRPAGLVTLIALIIYLGFQPTAKVAMVSALIATMLALAIQMLIFRKKLRQESPPSTAIYHTAFWFKNAAPFLLVEAFYLILANTDLLMLGKFVSPEKVGIYYAAMRTSGLISFIMFAVSALSAPKFSSLHGQNQKAQLANLFAGSVRLTFWPSLILAVILAIFGIPVLALFGPAFVDGYSAMLILTLSIVFKAAAGPVDLLLNMTGHQNRCAKILGVSACINVLLNIIFIPILGMLGAAIATALSVVISTLLLAYQAKTYLGIQVFRIKTT